MSLPVDLGRDEAARLAREELARQVYREAGPGLVERGLRWVLARLGELLDEVAGLSPGGYAGLAVLVLLVVAVVVAVRLRVGPLGRAVTAERALFVGREVDADEHRRRADALAAGGDWDGAVQERLRAVVRHLEQCAVLEPRPGRTAVEAAAEAGQALPGCAAGLVRAARLFDDVRYGGRPAGREHDDELRALDAAVRAARPATTVLAR